MNKKNPTENFAALRIMAEELLKKRSPKTASQLSEEGTLKLLHEVEVQQIEMGLQQEELMWTKEQSSKVAREKYAELYDFAPLGYFTLSKEGEIIAINPIGANMLGKERSRLINSRIGFFVSDDTKPIFRLFLDKVFGSNTKESCEVTLLSNGSAPIFAYLNGIATENGEQCLVAVVNITDRKRVEEALAVSETRYRRLFESAKDGILILDAETGLIMDVNPFLIELLGYSKEQLFKKEIWEIGLFKDIAANQDKFLELKEKQFVRYEDLPLETAQGRKINVEFVSNVYIADKKKVIQCNIRDITARKQVENALRESEENLRKINAEKDKFFSIVAHDLRSPFNGFLGLTKILVEQLPDLKMVQIQKIALLLRNSAINLFGLLGNLLEWSSMQSGLTTFVPKLFLLKPKIAEIMVLVLEAANKKEIAITIDIPEDLPVFADVNMFGVIIRNLVTNAVKFTPRCGNINVSARPATDESVEISVRDSGIGMNQKLIDDLFRIDSKTNREGTEGELSTGLGLLLCRDFIEKHGGKLRIESEEGKGSVFSFTLDYKYVGSPARPV